jgi:hypothetical protein
MKKIPGSVLLLFAIIILAGCNGNRSAKKQVQITNDTVSVPDTGYTGIKKYMSGHYIAKEVTFKNGVKDGLMKTFYVSGKLRQTFWYKNGLKQDSSRWYFEEGQLFRATPYKNDTIDGIQKQYYRTGQLKGEIGFKKGFRTPEFKEYSKEGKLVTGYPQLVVKTQDNYKTKGTYIVSFELSNKSPNVKFFSGDVSRDIFDTAHCQKINTIKGIGTITLKKTGKPTSANIGVIANVVTSFGNNFLIFKKIDLPYNDLN